MGEYIFLSNSPTATFSFGKRLGQKLRAGSILALMGELGCGKTLLTRGICTGLDVSTKYVNSPTFILVNEYRGRLPVFHMDLYRLENAADGFEMGILDYLVKADNGVIIIEWAEKILPILPDSCLNVQFDILSARRRRMILTGTGDSYRRLIREIDE